MCSVRGRKIFRVEIDGKDDSSFESFFSGDHNDAIVKDLEALASAAALVSIRDNGTDIITFVMVSNSSFHFMQSFSKQFNLFM